MDDSVLLAQVRRESYEAEQYVTSEITQERENALERYLGYEYGDEVEGRSRIITREVFEQIEWAMPSLIKVFASGDQVIEYSPEGPEDEEAAQQCTDYANYIFYNDNNGFLILNTWFKDALLQKMGVVKSFWEEKEKTTSEEYTGLSYEQFLLFENDETVKIDSHTVKDVYGDEIGDDDDLELDEFGQLPVSFHDIEITRKVTEGRIKTLPIPPEEFYISRKGADPDDAMYLEHRSSKYASDLIAEGYSKKIVDAIPGDDTNDPTGEKETRFGNSRQEDERADPAMREIVVHESYIYLDKTGNGIATRHKVTWASSTILECEPCEFQPFSIVEPIPIPHRAYGLSFGDVVSPLQRIKTVLMRQTLDNLYLANNPEREVDINKVVSMDDLLMSRPGGIKRVKQIGAIREISHPFVAQHSFPMLDGIDGMMSARTGVSDAVTGIDADVLQNQTATASNNNSAAANQRLEMYTRLFAETGVRHLFKTYLRLMTTHQDKPRTIRLRNEWVEIDPRSWNANMDVSVDVGLGHGNKEQQVTHLMGLLNWQKELLASGGLGMVDPKHIYNTFEKLIKAVGFKSVDAFMKDPGDGPLPQQPQAEDPNKALIQGQMQIEDMKIKGKMSEKQLELMAKDQEAQRKYNLEMMDKQLEQEKLTIEREKIASNERINAAKIDSDKEQAAANLYAQARKTDAEAEQKDKDRVVSMTEKEKDRHNQLCLAASKQPKTVRMERGEDGSLTGSVE